MPGLFDQNAGGVPAPGTRKPSLVDRVAARLFPFNPEYGALLDPDQERQLQHRQLQRLGVGLLQAGAPKPQGTSNFLGNLGEALQGSNWDETMAQAAQLSASMDQRNRQAQEREALQGILAAHPPAANETDEQTRSRLLTIRSALQQSGFLELADKLNESIRVSTGGPVQQARSPDGSEVRLISSVTGQTIFTQHFDQKPGEDPNTWQRRVALAGEATRANDEPIGIAAAYRNLLSLSSQPQSTGRDQSLLFAFAHLVDPRTTLASAQGLTAADADKIHGLAGEGLALFNAFFKEGKPLNVADLLRQAKILARNAYDQFDRSASYYEGVAGRGGVDPKDVIDRTIWAGLGFGPGGGGAHAREGDDLLRRP